ncbi:YlbG family protein [Limosilactobacillus sp.]|uniref:YlbG family protein n=1 Tax=Limosilactobacillus sp. TaxID=2773925 RepID=UPI00345E1B81
MAFQPTSRRSLIVHIKSMRAVRSVRHYGNLIYVSRKMHYLVLYVDQKEIDSIAEKITKLRNVDRVEQSAWPDLDPELTQLRQEMDVQHNEEDDFK